ncbi:DEAD/DEAH box helicase [Bacillus solimangrovi]|uniref:DEAD-box ATP-dependent RNA helicase CshB n=1 Tax=Bacillus solimangrovi TaxID=1305675 RepID=A0A1E5LI34_9BACI|nr:DEAD/DEAH box helicase [Bacillus solimangrovi]OEH93721.1 DEAD/DEAH box helicase [Bacillus solimangrovi]
MKTTQFERFSFKPFIIDAIKELGFYQPTDIQERIIPSIINGESAVGQAQTGTGKTHAYLLPIFEKVNPSIQEVQTIITAPTRELATQIFHEARKIAAHFPEEEQVSVRCYVGGTDKNKAIDKLSKQPQIVIGTPGRINDLVREQALLVHTATMIVVDEADMMLDMGFIHDVDEIASRLADKLQMLVFSATVPEKLKPFMKKYMSNPRFFQVEADQPTPKKITHYLVPLRHRNELETIHELAVMSNPYLMIIFANTKKKADEIADYLLGEGLNVGRLHGDLNPRERKNVMKKIRNAQYQYVVATDLAARGIDIQGVSHVLNANIPHHDLSFYIHRVGRSARAEFSGEAITLYEARDEDALNKLEKMGVSFKHVDFRNQEWIDLGPRNKRKKRERGEDEIEKTAQKIVAKSKKVKPGYKKKRKRQVDQMKRKMKRNQRNK